MYVLPASRLVQRWGSSLESAGPSEWHVLELVERSFSRVLRFSFLLHWSRAMVSVNKLIKKKNKTNQQKNKNKTKT